MQARGATAAPSEGAASERDDAGGSELTHIPRRGSAASPVPPLPAARAAPTGADDEDDVDTAAVIKGALAGIVDKPSLYLVRAAQATTLRQLKSARKELRDFNTTARVQLEGQMAALEAAAAQLGAVRADLDAVNVALRMRKQQLIEAHPEMRQRLAARCSEDG